MRITEIPALIQPSFYTPLGTKRIWWTQSSPVRNSASVELVAAIDWVLQRHEMTPPLRTKAHPVVDRRFLRSLPWAASKNAIIRASFPAVGNGGDDGSMSNRSSGCAGRDGSTEERWQTMLQDFVALKHLATFFNIVKWTSAGHVENLLRVITACPMSGRHVTCASYAALVGFNFRLK